MDSGQNVENMENISQDLVRETPPAKSVEPERKRRSSAGADLLASFMTENEMEKIPTPELKAARPKRMAALKARQEQAKTNGRLSIDVGERPNIRSCLKRGESVARLCAGKISDKYRKNFKKSKSTDKSSNSTSAEDLVDLIDEKNDEIAKLRFNEVCTIRVITPRSDYDPNNLNFPSDDEDSSNPSRHRLSTVNLNITPTSQAYLASIKGKEENEQVQFRAKMIFGDEYSPPTRTAAEESIPSTFDPFTPIKIMEMDETVTGSSSEAESRSGSGRKRKTKRKSLIGGAGLALLSPKERIDEIVDTEKKASPPKFPVMEDDPAKSSSINRRRSVRLTCPLSATPSEKMDVDSESRNEQEKIVSTVSQSKKNRRKSGFIAAKDLCEDQIKSPEKKRPDRRRSYVIDCESTSGEDTVLKTKDKNSRKDVKCENNDAKKEMKKTRRKSGFFNSKNDDKEKNERKHNFFTPISKAETLNIEKDEIVVVDTVLADNLKKEPKKDRRRSVFIGNVTEPEIKNLDVKKKIGRRSFFEPKIEVKSESVVSKVSISSPAPAIPPAKLFALFSPRPPLSATSSPVVEKKPAPFVDQVEIIEEKKNETILEVDEMNVSKVSMMSSSSIASGGRKREKLWGDRIATTYSYLTNQKLKNSVLKEKQFKKDWFLSEPRCSDQCSSTNEENFVFKLRSDNVGDELDGYDVVDPQDNDPDATENSFNIGSELEKEAENLKSVGVCEYKPTKLQQLVEGKDEIERVRNWLKKWKKRVRKEAIKQEDAKKGKTKKGRSKKTSSDEDSDDDYQESDGEEFENPLILVGPTGVGKTAFINALANEQNMKIIGMGPDEERKGTSIKSKLTEAMRSHRVNVSDSAGSLVRFFQNKAVEYSKTSSDSTIPVKTKTEQKTVLDKEFAQSLVVFEHVDLLFGNFDRNASMALIELVNTAMVPVVWTCDENYPGSTASVELEKRPLVVHLTRKKSKVRKYCQKLIYSAKNVWIDDSTMKKLASSVKYDLRGLIQQAYFFALAPELPLPLSCRAHASNGFSTGWEYERKENEALDDEFANIVWNKYEHKLDRYMDVIREVSDGSVRINYPYIDRMKTKEELRREDTIRSQNENYRMAFSSFYGRFSPKDMIMDAVPFLDYIDKSEKKRKEAATRRYTHRFVSTLSSDYPIDDDKLITSLARIRSNCNYDCGL